jgi:hypothetical protein
MSDPRLQVCWECKGEQTVFYGRTGRGSFAPCMTCDGQGTVVLRGVTEQLAEARGSEPELKTTRKAKATWKTTRL